MLKDLEAGCDNDEVASIGDQSDGIENNTVLLIDESTISIEDRHVPHEYPNTSFVDHQILLPSLEHNEIHSVQFYEPLVHANICMNSQCTSSLPNLEIPPSTCQLTTKTNSDKHEESYYTTMQKEFFDLVYSMHSQSHSIASDSPPNPTLSPPIIPKQS